MKRPRPPLRSAQVAKIRNDRGLAWLAALAGWIEEQQLAAEVEPDTRVGFGWSRVLQGKPSEGRLGRRR